MSVPSKSSSKKLNEKKVSNTKGKKISLSERIKETLTCKNFLTTFIILLLMIICIVLGYKFLQKKDTYNDLKNSYEQLEEKLAELEEYEKTLQNKNKTIRKLKKQNEDLQAKKESLESQKNTLNAENKDLKEKSKKVKAYNDVVENFLYLASTLEDEPTQAQINQIVDLANKTGDDELINQVNNCVKKDELNQNDFFIMIDTIVDGISENSG